MSTVQASASDINSTMGAMYIGVSVAGIFYGATVVQTWYYYTHYNDTWPMKALVAAVFLCDSMHQVFIAHMLYVYLVMNFENPVALGSLVWSLVIEVLFNGLVGILVQSFFAYRIYQLSRKSIPLTCLVASLSLAEFGLSIAFTAEAMYLSTFEELLSLKNLSRSVNAVAAAGNVTIALSMVFLLSTNRTGLRKADSIINRLIMFSLNTGLLTSFCAVMSLVTISAFPGTLIYTAFFFVLGRVYTNSFLASLNARHRLQRIHVEEGSWLGTIHLTYIFSPSSKDSRMTESMSGTSGQP